MILNEAMKSLGRHRMVAVPLVMREALVMKLVFGAALLAPGLLAAQAARPATAPAAAAWRSLFDGKSLVGWKESDFFGAGKVTVEKGVITIGSGALTGINWAPSSLPFPTSNYEVLIEAARLKGTDFFAGITFPAGASFCTWINGGWGGAGLVCDEPSVRCGNGKEVVAPPGGHIDQLVPFGIAAYSTVAGVRKIEWRA